jgi:hypothetical protein
VLVLSQSSFVSPVKGANFFNGTIYGGPTTIGFAKTDAVAGGIVSVSLSGAVDGYSNLRPGNAG